MTTDDLLSDDLLWDPLDATLYEFPNIAKHLVTFQIDTKSNWRCKPKEFKDSIFVFKKKKLLNSQARYNIYNVNQDNLELDRHDHDKSRISCLRCRKFKKKCTRDLPECHNCVSSEELCVYNPRKKRKRRVTAAKPHLEIVPTLLTHSASVSSEEEHSVPRLPAFETLIQPTPLAFEPRTPAGLGFAPSALSQHSVGCRPNCHSDLYRLLN